jgi:hypothetical protein
MSYHLLADVDRNVLTTIVNRDGVTQHLRQIVEARDQVLITCFSPLAFKVSTFFSR